MIYIRGNRARWWRGGRCLAALGGDSVIASVTRYWCAAVLRSP